MTKIAVLGTGHVACVFVKGLVKNGFEVRIGTREPSKPKEEVSTLLKELGKSASELLMTTAEAVKFSDLVLLASNWKGAKPTLDAAGSALDGKVVIDVTNPIGDHPAYIAQLEKLELGGGEYIQQWAPKAKIVKAWNTVGNAMFIKPSMVDGKMPTMFICGNDAEAKKKVSELLSAVGWSAFDIGNIEFSRYLEAMCTVWCNYSLKTGNWAWALGVHDGKK